jgi:hypothetical protein
VKISILRPHESELLFPDESFAGAENIKDKNRTGEWCRGRGFSFEKKIFPLQELLY